jgi:uncharacterized protein YfiM (DUF2279 family)
MKRFIIAMLCLLSATAHADQWTGTDKDKHAIAGLTIAAAVSAASRPAYGIAAGCAVGMAKEVYDRYTPGHQVSARDAIVTCLGAAVGAYVPGLLVSPRGIGYRFTF